MGRPRLGNIAVTNVLQGLHLFSGSSIKGCRRYMAMISYGSDMYIARFGGAGDVFRGGGFPKPPTLYFQVFNMLGDGASSATGIGQVISQDTEMTSRILKIANSSIYSFSSDIESISRVVSLNRPAGAKSAHRYLHGDREIIKYRALEYPIFLVLAGQCALRDICAPGGRLFTHSLCRTSLSVRSVA